MKQLGRSHSNCLKIKIRNVLEINQVDVKLSLGKVTYFLLLDSWEYANMIKSTVRIIAESLQMNETYQFLVEMVNRHDATRRSIGYLTVEVENIQSPRIMIGLVRFFFNLFSNNHFSCVISTMCLSTGGQSHYVNPTTQFALFSVCFGNCSSMNTIQWNIYQRSNQISQWTLFSSTSSSLIYGKS